MPQLGIAWFAHAPYEMVDLLEWPWGLGAAVVDVDHRLEARACRSAGHHFHSLMKRTNRTKHWMCGKTAHLRNKAKQPEEKLQQPIHPHMKHKVAPKERPRPYLIPPIARERQIEF